MTEFARPGFAFLTHQHAGILADSAEPAEPLGGKTFRLACALIDLFGPIALAVKDLARLIRHRAPNP